MILETKDLIIKKGEQKDWRDMYYNLWRHSESAKYMLWNVTTSEEEAQARMERTIAFQAAHDYAWLIYEKQSGQAIGFAGLEELEGQVCKETGIAIGPEFTRKGYGRQVLNALTDFARDALGAQKFVACVELQIRHLTIYRCPVGFNIPIPKRKKTQGPVNHIRWCIISRR